MAQKQYFSPTLLQNKVALITGGGSGIGRAIAECFLAHGARVGIVGRRASLLEQATAAWKLQYGPSSCAFAAADVRSPEAAAAAVSSIASALGVSALDVVVNNAAGNFLCALEDISPNGFRTVLEIDLLGTLHVAQAARPYLLRSPGACILNISATLHYAATRYQAHAASAKAGVDALTRSIAAEWGPRIRCNGVAPGPIGGTEGMRRLAPGGAGEAVGERLPAGRLGSAEDVALACLFLASDAAAFVTGHTMVVDGGAWVGQQASVPPEVYDEIKKSRAKL